MYADRYAKPSGLRPGSLALALLFNGAILGSLAFFSAPKFIKAIEHDFVLHTYTDPPPPPPLEKTPPKQKEIKIEPVQRETQQLTKTIVSTTTANNVTVDRGPPTTGTLDGGIGVKIDPIPIPKPPLIIGPQVDSRFAAGYQPIYPADERRAGNQGRVTVRVLIGVDGRVKQVEKISATSDSFFEVTRKRALEKWRFKPGTQDGIPVEAWRTMSVSFVLDGTE